MRQPRPRGPVSEQVLLILGRPPRDDDDDESFTSAVIDAVQESSGIRFDEDLQLTLFCLYELHYRGLDGVDERWEWNPGLLRARARIERAFELTLRREVTVEAGTEASADSVAAALFALTAEGTGPSLSTYIARSATRDQLREFLVHRSIYHLKEADPHTWAIPRLTGRAKAALVEVQADEYGGGRPERMHSELFAATMRGLGLDDSYGAYVDCVPAITLAAVNMMSMFGLHRRLRGAIAGHLAAFEMTSSIPNRRYGNGFRRHGFSPDVTWYFDEHVEADAVHEQIAGRDLAGGLAESEPGVLNDIFFGAAACLAMDELVATHLMASWARGETSLRAPNDAAA
jgi:hypothetical protein